MWTRGAAIRPIPVHSVIDKRTLEKVEEELSSEADEAEDDLDAAFARFETSQPALATKLNAVLSRPLDDTALALGYFLGIAVWLAFERQFAGRIAPVDEVLLRAIEEALGLEEELRAARAHEPVEVEDVVAQEQPALVAFLNEHVEAALDARTGESKDDVDVDDVALVYRSMLIELLSLSYVVAPAPGAMKRDTEEILA